MFQILLQFAPKLGFCQYYVILCDGRKYYLLFTVIMWGTTAIGHGGGGFWAVFGTYLIFLFLPIRILEDELQTGSRPFQN